VFIRSGGVWTQQGGKLVGTGAVGGAQQGTSVSLSSDGNTAIVGGVTDNSNAGAAWVFIRSGGVWTQQGSKLVGTGAVGNASQGQSVSLSSDGNTAIVGGYYDNTGAGAAWVWTRSGGVWTLQGSKLVGTGAVGNASQGQSVSLSSDGYTVIVGGVGDNSAAGAAWVWTRSGGVWTQQGSKLVGTGAIGNAQQGTVALSSDGNTAIVGGNGDASHAGAVWVFIRSGGVWTQQGSKLVGTGAVGAADQGMSVSLSSDGNTAIVGGASDNSFAGAAWIYATPNVPPIVTPPPHIFSVKDVPHDQGGKVTLQWQPSSLDTNVITLPFYSIWRTIPQGMQALGKAVTLKDNAMVFHGDAYRYAEISGVTYAWEWIANQPAHRFAQYSYTAPTLYDSMSTTGGKHYFLISAQTSDPNVFYNSNVDSGYSVDNIPPLTPRNLMVSHAVGMNTLHWSGNSDIDLRNYVVYREISPNNLTVLASVTDTQYVDSNLPAQNTLYYAIRAQDIHENLSLISNPVVVTGVMRENEIPKQFSLAQNYPNPFNPSTTIRYGLASQSKVRLIITNTLGQQVAVLANGEQEAGYHEVQWQASVASGIHFYRIDAVSVTDPNNRFMQVKKMLLLR
jgi:hypothetical protein